MIQSNKIKPEQKAKLDKISQSLRFAEWVDINAVRKGKHKWRCASDGWGGTRSTKGLFDIFSKIKLISRESAINYIQTNYQNLGLSEKFSSKEVLLDTPSDMLQRIISMDKSGKYLYEIDKF